MDSTQLKENFEKQLAEAEKQIAELQDNLAKATEYRTKLLGGLETLKILEDGESQEPEVELEIPE
jgi:cellobiose-specific phosphotransferase system component IIA